MLSMVEALKRPPELFCLPRLFFADLLFLTLFYKPFPNEHAPLIIVSGNCFETFLSPN